MTLSAHKASREMLESFGYTPEVISFLGFSELKGVGFDSLRNIGGPQDLIKILGIEDSSEFIYKLNRVGVKGFLFPEVIKTRDELKQIIWNLGLELAFRLANLKVYFLDGKDISRLNRINVLPSELMPKWLFARGRVNLLDSPSIAVVGTRKPNEDGISLTKYVVGLLAELNLPVVSGLAYGIDTEAHRAALEIALPTISILGSGILVPYPAKNIALADKIIEEDGLIISEYLPNADPTKDSFIWRNRLQASISSAVVATQWKSTSGTAHTIRFAKQFGRPSISVGCDWATAFEDAGRAEAHFELPSQAAHFNDQIRSSIANNGNQLRKQNSLFEGL